MGPVENRVKQQNSNSLFIEKALKSYNINMLNYIYLPFSKRSSFLVLNGLF